MIVGQIEIQMMADMARLQADMNAAKNSVTGAMSSIQNSVAMAKGALAGLGLVGIAASMAASIKAAIDQADAMNKLAQRTGIATESLSQLQYVANMSGVANETLATGIKKLNVSIAEGLAGDKAKIALFQELGIKLNDTSGKAKAADAVLLDMADAFAKAKDGAGKTAISVGLLGKAGDEMIPLLNGGRQAIVDMMREADKLGLTIGSDFAKKSEEFNDNLERIHKSSQKLTIVLAGELVDGLGKAMKAMAEATIEGGKLAGVIAAWQTLMTGDDMHKANVEIVKGTELVMAAQNALDAARARGDAELIARREKLLKLRTDELATHTNYLKMLEQEKAASDAASAALEKARTAGRELKIKNDEAAAAAKKAAEEAARKAEEQAKLLAELAGLTGSFAKEWANLNEIYKAGKLDMQGLEQAQAKLLAKQPAIKEMHDAEIKYAQEVSAARVAARAKEEEGINAYMLAQEQARHQEEKGAQDALKAAEDLYTQYGKSKSQIEELAIAELKLKQARVSADSEEYASLQRQIEMREKLVTVLADTEALDRQKEVWQSIEQTAHTTFTNIFQGGQDAFTKLRDTLKATLLDLLYQMTVKRWIFDISASVSGSNVASAAFPGMASGAAGGGGLGGVFGGLGNLGGFGSSIGLFGSGFKAGLGAVFGESGTLGGLSAGTTAIGAGNIAGGLGTLAGAALPWIGGAALLRNLMDYNITPTGGGLTASLTSGGTSTGMVGAYNSFHQQGGLFGGGGTDNRDWSVADSGTTSYLIDNVRAVTAANKAYATSLGLNAAALDGYTKDIDINTAGMDAAAVRAALDAEVTRFSGEQISAAYGQALASVALTGETTTQTLTRLATDLDGMNSMFSQLGYTLFDVSVTGAAAASTLANAFGGLAAAQAQLGSYYQNFYTMAEQQSNTYATVQADLQRAGITVSLEQLQTASRADIRAAVDSLAGSTNTAEGAARYAAAVQAANTLAGIKPALDAIAATSGQPASVGVAGGWVAGSGGGSGGVVGAANDLTRAFQSLTDAMFKEEQRVRDQMAGGGSEGLARSQARLATAHAMARAGDKDAAAALPQLNQAMLLLAESNARTLDELNLIRGRAANSLHTTGTLLAGQYGLSIPSFDVGTNMVPRDMLALIHAGEAIVPQAYNPALGGGGMGGNTARLEALVEELTAEVASLKAPAQATAENTGTMKKVLVSVTHNGEGVLINEDSLTDLAALL